MFLQTRLPVEAYFLSVSMSEKEGMRSLDSRKEALAMVKVQLRSVKVFQKVIEICYLEL